jgi:hypothetical protein
MKVKLFAVLLAVLLLAGIGAVAEGTMTVKGTGVVSVDADTANISLGVRLVADDVMTAQSQVNEKLAAIIDALNGAGVGREAISTNSIGIYTNYDYSTEEERITGYTAYNSILITLTDVDSVGAVIDTAFAAGANSLDYVEFSARNTAEAADKALALAVDSAKKKAQTLADAAGVKLGDIVQITDNQDYGYDDSSRAYAVTEEADAGSGTMVLASKQTVTANVIITFAIGE